MAEQSIKGILLVEDDQNDVTLLQYAFKKAGVKVPIHILENGQQAIDYLAGAGQYANRDEYPLPRLAMIDLNLPIVPGLDVLDWIAAQPALKTVAVLVLTSSCNQQDVEEARSRGAQAFLVKPISNEERVQLVKFIQKRWLEPAPGPPPCEAQPGPLVAESIYFVAGPRPD